MKMNENGQIAVLTDGNDNYCYYIYNDEIIRIDGKLDLMSNPTWAYDILIEDLENMDIVYLSEDVAFYATEEEMEDYYGEAFPDVVRKINEYQEVH